MSEAAPGIPDAPEFATPERARVAEAVRSLIDAVMTTPDAEAGVLTAAAADVERVTAALTGSSASSSKSRGYHPRSHGDYLPRSPVVGEASPLSPRLDWEFDGTRLHARGVFTAAYEGPPGFVHGGIIALAFDEILGIVNTASGMSGMTGTLTVRYRRPTPLYDEVRFEARVERAGNRRILSRGELWAGETLCAEAEGIFVQPRPKLVEEYFGERR